MMEDEELPFGRCGIERGTGSLTVSRRGDHEKDVLNSLGFLRRVVFKIFRKPCYDNNVGLAGTIGQGNPHREVVRQADKPQQPAAGSLTDAMAQPASTKSVAHIRACSVAGRLLGVNGIPRVPPVKKQRFWHKICFHFPAKPA